MCQYVNLQSAKFYNILLYLSKLTSFVENNVQKNKINQKKCS